MLPAGSCLLNIGAKMPLITLLTRKGPGQQHTMTKSSSTGQTIPTIAQLPWIPQQTLLQSTPLQGT